MLIKNVRNGDTINIRRCRNPFGLMFKLKFKSAIYFAFKKRYESVHMFFVFFPIDVLFIRDNKIVAKKRMLPFTISKSYLCDIIIEAEKGRFREWGVGDGIKYART